MISGNARQSLIIHYSFFILHYSLFFVYKGKDTTRRSRRVDL
jgi:hypothetical protein